MHYYPVDVKDLQVPKATYQLKIDRVEDATTQFTWSKQNSWLDATAVSEHNRKTELSRLYSEISHLFSDDEYDGDFLRPTDHAVYSAKLLLTKVKNILSELPVGGYVSTDGSGGLRVDWSAGEKNVRLIIAGSPSGKSYIYHEAGSEYGVDRNVSPEVTSRWLNWLIA